MNINLKELLPVVVVPVASWIMSTYAFTEIMKERMNNLTHGVQTINTKTDKIIAVQADQEVRIRLLEDAHGRLELKVERIETGSNK